MKHIIGFLIGIVLTPLVIIIALMLPALCFIFPDCIKFKGKSIFK